MTTMLSRGMTPEEIARKMDVSLKDLDILLSAP